MRKNEVETRRGLPCINIKAYRFPTVDDVTARFGSCTGDQAAKALEFAFESACREFWEDAEDLVASVFPHARTSQEGRLGGWLVVHNLPYVIGWNAVDLAKWASLCRKVKDLVTYLCSEEKVLEDTEANQWYKEGSEEYNFVDTADGRTLCIADLKSEARAKGFGPVVRA